MSGVKFIKDGHWYSYFKIESNLCQILSALIRTEEKWVFLIAGHVATVIAIIKVQVEKNLDRTIIILHVLVNNYLLSHVDIYLCRD